MPSSKEELERVAAMREANVGELDEREHVPSARPRVGGYSLVATSTRNMMRWANLRARRSNSAIRHPPHTRTPGASRFKVRTLGSLIRHMLLLRVCW